jgi:osmotically-inducible protein OsmY
VTDRVKSEVLGRRDLGATNLLVDVQDGVVHLRGELDDPATIDRVVELTKQVPGVLEVENLTHRPGAAAPNKATARSTGNAKKRPA